MSSRGSRLGIKDKRPSLLGLPSLLFGKVVTVTILFMPSRVNLISLLMAQTNLFLEAEWMMYRQEIYQLKENLAELVESNVPCKLKMIIL